MARASQWAKMNRPPKFSTRAVNRCHVLRPRAWLSIATSSSAVCACASWHSRASFLV